MRTILNIIRGHGLGQYSITVLGLCFVLSLFSLAATAEATTGLSIQPVKVSHTIEPGQHVEGVISLTNAGDEEVNVELNVEDFIPTAGAEGIQFVGRAPGVTTVRDWIQLEGDQHITLTQGEHRNITYTISAPEDAEPGSHFGVAFFKATKAASEGEQLKVGTQVGMLIFVTVPGNFLQQGVINNFSGPGFVQRGPITFLTEFENTGTVHFEPKGTIKITNIFGKEVGEVTVEGQAVLPTGIKELKTIWDTAGVLLGRYTAEIVLFDGEGNAMTTDTAVFYAFPIAYSAGVVVAVVLLFYILKFLKTRVSITVKPKDDSQETNSASKNTTPEDKK